MHSWQLSQSEKDAALPLINALKAEGLEVARWQWKYIPEVEEFYLLVTTPAIGKLGISEVLQAQNRAIEKANVAKNISSRLRLIGAVKE
jgi:hypothetical protein